MSKTSGFDARDHDEDLRDAALNDGLKAVLAIEHFTDAGFVRAVEHDRHANFQTSSSWNCAGFLTWLS